MDLLKQAGAALRRRLRFRFRHFEKWLDLKLPAGTAKMLEVEASQLLLSQMPGLPAAAHNRASLAAIAKLPQCSRVLRAFLSGWKFRKSNLTES